MSSVHKDSSAGLSFIKARHPRAAWAILIIPPTA